MRIPKIYLETTIFNHYFDTDREAHFSTVKLFEKIRSEEYEAFTSLYVTDELKNAPEPKRTNMLNLIREYNITILPASDDVGNLANIYIKEGVLPAKFLYDGLHIAAAAINDLEYIFSHNFKHINKLKTKVMTSNINFREGYRSVIIASPMEVFEDEE